MGVGRVLEEDVREAAGLSQAGRFVDSTFWIQIRKILVKRPFRSAR